MKKVVIPTVSPKYQLIWEDKKSVLIGAILMSLGTGAVYFIELISKMDFGDWTPVIAIVSTILINLLRKWLGEQSYLKK